MILFTHHLLFLFSGFLLLVLLTFAWKHRNIQSGQIFLLMLALALLWNITFFLELILTDLDMKILMVQFQFIAIGFIPTVWFIFAAVYTGFPLNQLHVFILSSVPTLTSLIIWLVPRPNWFWGIPAIDSSGLFPVLNYNYQFWYYYIFTPASHLIFLMATGLLIRAYYKKPSVYRFQILTTITALLIPLSVNLLYVFGFSLAPGVNYTSAMFGFSALIIGWSLYRYKFLDLLPMAHEIIFEKIEEGILILDFRGRVVDANPVAMHILNILTENIGGPLPLDSDHPALQCVGNMISKKLKSGSFSVLESDCDGSPCHYECSIVYVDDAAGDHLACIINIRDNTEQKMLFQRIHEQSIQDELTGIFNRRYFFQKGKNLLDRILHQQSGTLSLLAIDIDNLKPVNDRYGHVAGDKVLKTFSDITRQTLRPLDVLCRLGGDEFAVLLPDTDITAACGVADRIIENIRSTQIILPASKEAVSFSISIGIAGTDSLNAIEIPTIDDLLNIADTRMYTAKNEGGGRAVDRNQAAGE